MNPAKALRQCVLHEDAAIVVVNKPAGVLTVPDRHDPSKLNVTAYLRSRYDNILIVHRLDRDTSGVLVFARTAEAHRDLSLQFQNRTVTKHYRTLVAGQVAHDEGLIDKPIVPHPHIGGKMIVARKGKASQTRYTVLERFQRHTWLDVELLTGRTHQIRVHFLAQGYPLAVDPLYGKRERLALSDIKPGYRHPYPAEERPLLGRLSLHAATLAIHHPDSKERLTFEAPLPKDLRALLQQLRKWAAI